MLRYRGTLFYGPWFCPNFKNFYFWLHSSFFVYLHDNIIILLCLTFIPNCPNRSDYTAHCRHVLSAIWNRCTRVPLHLTRTFTFNINYIIV